jgi:hypothetical protein
MRLPTLRPSKFTPVAILAGAAALACCATLAPAAASEAAPRPAASTPPCTTADLVIWMTPGGAAAGTAFFSLNFTNLSGRACTLDGHPGVSAVSLRGRRVGSPAGWDAPAPSVVKIANDGTAYALVRYSDVIVGNNGPTPCDAVVSAGLRVFPPGQTAAKTVPFPLDACTRSIVYMNVGSVQAKQPLQ